MSESMPFDMGVQTFSVAYLEMHPFQILDYLARLGGDVEIAGYLDLESAKFAEYARRRWVTVLGAMVDHNKLKTDIDFVIKRVKPVHPKYLVTTADDPHDYFTAFRRMELRDMLNERGQILQAQLGAQLAIHHHDFELKRVSGRDSTTLFEDMLDKVDPRYAKAVLDTGWIYAAGLDVPNYIRRLPGQVLVIHCKDISRDDPTRTVPVGRGILNWHAIIEAALESGAHYLMVELDKSPDPLQELETALNNLRTFVYEVLGQRARSNG